MKSDDRWLLLVDLDGTLWDHLDISALQPPFTRVSYEAIVDSRGVKVRLYTEMVEAIKWAKSIGAIVVALSWNIPEKAIEALKTFNVLELFDYLGIENHPDKGAIALRIVRDIEGKGYKVKPCRIIYVDDRDIHLEGVKRRLGDIVFLRAWVDFRNLEDFRNRILEALKREC